MSKLLDLPRELQLQIYRKLCPHCLLFSERDFPLRPHLYLYASSGGDCRALKCLTLTCHQLRNIVQPLVFHWVTAPARPIIPFLCLLLLRPDLGRDIKIFDPAMNVNIGDYELSQTEVNIVNGLIQREVSIVKTEEPIRWGMRERKFTDTGEVVSWFPQNRYLHDVGAPGYSVTFYSDIQATLYALLFHMIPGVEFLRLETSSETFPFIGHQILTSLKELFIYHNRPICLRDICLLAPQLETLFGCGFNLSLPLEQHILKHISMLENYVQASSIDSLLFRLVDLESFCCNFLDQVISEDTMTPFRLSQTLLHRRETLKELRISFNLDLETQQNYPEICILGSLSAMEVLRVIQLNSKTLFNHELLIYDDFALDKDCSYDLAEIGAEGVANDTIGLQAAKDILTDFLPRSVESLMLTPDSSHLFNALIHLAQRCPIDFPNLRKIWVWGLSPGMQTKVNDVFLATEVQMMGEPVNGDQDFLPRLWKPSSALEFTEALEL